MTEKEKEFRALVAVYTNAAIEAAGAESNPFCDPNDTIEEFRRLADKLDDAIVELFRARSSEG